MSDEDRFEKAPGYQDFQATADLFLMNAGCRLINGTHACAANNMDVVSDDAITMIMLQAGRACIYVGMTPDGVRHFAAQLVEVANKVEAQFQSSVNTRLAATLAKRGDQ
ncbi:hypothetical protein [Novosphingobium capsulatum]|uniref:hypothetical protein n=1 Tax=Novosphingobium capsulatum TaxID=13688 RepID=UPI002E0EBEDC|nr:hypothetical protein U0041_03895 [Novosphingobium capsulatum]